MKKEEAIDRISEINRLFKQGDKCSPAHRFDEQTIHIDLFGLNNKETNELMNLISDWSYNRESKIKHDLHLERSKLESQLKELL